MNEKIEILLVEDDEDQIQSFEDRIGLFNDDNEFEIVLTSQKSLRGALEILNKNFDAAIIDLKLSYDEPDKESGGKKVINEILDNFRMPIFIYTAIPGLMIEIERKEDIFFKKYVKSEVDIKTIIDEIINIYKSGITKIIGGRGLIEKRLNEIFWNHISNTFDYWIERSQSTLSEKILLRHISSYLTEYLDLSDSGEPENYYPPEFYLIPPVKKEIFTGDILKKKDEKYYIVLTPACDMIIRKDKNRQAEYFTLVSLEKWNNINKFSQLTKSTGKNNETRKNLERLMFNNKSRYHFLPRFKEIPGFFIDFQGIIIEKPGKANSIYQRIATVSMPILKDIIARFSQYYSRQGQPDLNIEEELQSMLPDG